MSIDKRRYYHVYIKDGKKTVEKTEMLGFLVCLYTSVAGKILRFILRCRWISVLYGLYQSSSFSAYKIKGFIEKHDINMQDFIEPAGGYRSFNEFFCRPLLAGAREIDMDVRALVSPADAKCWVLPEVTTNATFFVKQQEFSLESFLKDQHLAEYFNGGLLFLLRLAPYDYHRFHAPIAGAYSKPHK
ncbi:phosphatidylserine decarboxylase, partial [Candidatus Dependentiae bacterium]|nr:phosphatidylserine decarboxylase [Candidatus Dependentiae bacterium]